MYRLKNPEKNIYEINAKPMKVQHISTITTVAMPSSPQSLLLPSSFPFDSLCFNPKFKL